MSKIIIYTQAYNAELTIGATIESIQAQTFTDYCHYIVDNKSTDRTGSIIDEYAKNDKRIVKFVNAKNDMAAMRDFFPIILGRHSDECYGCILDADDTYLPTFFEKMLNFAKDNELDIAACGYDSIDALTGECIMPRALGYNLVLERKDLADQFLVYRRFMATLWAKLISFPVLKQCFCTDYMINKYRQYLHIIQGGELLVTTFAFLQAQKIGIWGEALHRYTVSKTSLSYQWNSSRVESDQALYKYTMDYLLEFGPVSKLNQDYMYAIYLGLIQGTLQLIYDTDRTLAEKLDDISQIFSCQITKDMLSLQADPQFRNLAERQQFLQSVINWMNMQDGIENFQTLAENIRSNMRGQ